MKPILHTPLLVFLCAIPFFSGCQTPAELRADRGGRVARVLGDFIVVHRRLPRSQAELVTYANTISDRAVIRRLHDLSFRALGPSIARVEYSDGHGFTEHRTVVVSARRPPKLTSGNDSLPPDILTDPNVLFVFSH
jgi:hypothetical protein